MTAQHRDPATIQLDAAAAHGLIDDLIYEHLVDLVDWPRVRLLEEILAGYFADAMDESATSDEVAKVERLASDMIATAWRRLIDDERRYMERAVPWDSDDDCVICRELTLRDVPGEPPLPS